MADTRLSQVVIEILSLPTAPPVRVSQDVVELLNRPTPPPIRVSQTVIEILAAAAASGQPVTSATLATSLQLFAPSVVRDQAVTSATRASTAALFAPTVHTTTAPSAISGATCPSTVQLFVPDVGVSVGAAVTQVVVETLALVPNAPVAATQVAAEVLSLPAGDAQVTQLVCELLVVPYVVIDHGPTACAVSPGWVDTLRTPHRRRAAAAPPPRPARTPRWRRRW